jgi:CRISPR-associated exonuclease Cas4
MDAEYLQLNGIQHFAYCRRQWALINIEQQWEENVRTVDGHLFHVRTHDMSKTEKRGDLLITRGLQVFSNTLGVTGICDVVEFHRFANGIKLHGWEGLWIPYPVEYKKGAPKEHNADELQLCCQAMCLEEMLLCSIPEGSLFYGEPRRRQPVQFTQELRDTVKSMLYQMHDLFNRGRTPEVKAHKGCNACSLKEICMPRLRRTVKVETYIKQHMEEE